MVRSEATAEASLAAMRDLKRFGIAIAAMIKIMATTISNSISEKPFCFFMPSPRMSSASKRLQCKLLAKPNDRELKKGPSVLPSALYSIDCAPHGHGRPTRQSACFDALPSVANDDFCPAAIDRKGRHCPFSPT